MISTDTSFLKTSSTVIWKSELSEPRCRDVREKRVMIQKKKKAMEGLLTIIAAVTVNILASRALCAVATGHVTCKTSIAQRAVDTARAVDGLACRAQGALIGRAVASQAPSLKAAGHASDTHHVLARGTCRAVARCRLALLTAT
jgi:hypothetical protein